MMVSVVKTARYALSGTRKSAAFCLFDFFFNDPCAVSVAGVYG